MSVGRIWAELAHVALADAERLETSSSADVKEVLRFRVLSARFAYVARAHGFCSQGGDYVWGNRPQTFRACRCGRRYETQREWDALPPVRKNGGIMEDGEGGFLQLRNCACGSTLAEPVVDHKV